jgi:hypothetical protein
MVTSAGRGSPASSTIVINHDLIVWRMNELDIDVREFTRRTGVQEYSLNTRSLDPARISVALLIRIATVLDVGVEDLLQRTDSADGCPRRSGCRRRPGCGDCAFPR